jgi:hypothetical protein
MTRINVIPPSELCRQHLIAEYRELPRIFSLVRKAVKRGESPNDEHNPTEYTLGKGHCRFFYNKLGYLAWRHEYLCDEMVMRDIRTNLRGFWLDYRLREDNSTLLGVSNEWWNDWKPTEEAILINRQRIAERMPKDVH